jgi:hypothetical protein
MFRHTPQALFEDKDLEELAAAMHSVPKEGDTPLGIVEEQENGSIPAGYTYLGQFIAHDISFDPVTSFDRRDDPDARRSMRTPRLDLDSIYGRGPVDQPYLYARDKVSFALGKRLQHRETPLVGFDLPRRYVPDTADGGDPAEALALIGDPRNDENRITSQLHCLWMRFHNALCRRLQRDHPGMSHETRFFEAQRLTRWHFQYVVLMEYLPLIIGNDQAHDLYEMEPAPMGKASGVRFKPKLHYYKPETKAYLPVEFSVAAFRFGHAMVRPSYLFNFKPAPSGASDGEGVTGSPLHRFPTFGGRTGKLDGSLRGLRPLPDTWVFDWDFFFGKLYLNGNDKWDPSFLQPSMRIDTRITHALSFLRREGIVETGPEQLALANLRRGVQLRLPSAQSIAERMGLIPLDIWALFDGELNGLPRAVLNPESDTAKRLAKQTPLWYYILREAEWFENGHHLGPMGGRIVGEVLVGLLAADKSSFVNVAPAWHPEQAGTVPDGTGTFGMQELVRFVLNSEKDQ